MTSPSYKIFVSPAGNIFMSEIAAALADAIGETGREVRTERTLLPTAEAGVVNLVVAPHEFFHLHEGSDEVEIVRAASHSIAVSVEQPGSPWFEVGARYASYGPMAIDITSQGVHELRRRGIEAYRLTLGYSPRWDAWHGASEGERDRDILFLGALTPRRSHFFSTAAPVFAEWRCDLRFFESTAPVATDTGHFVVGTAKHDLLAHSRVLVNVHQSHHDFFEWVRIVEAITNGCLVLTETSTGFAPLRSSEHFIAANLGTLAARVDAVLRDEPLRAALARQSYEFMRDHLALRDNVDRTLTVLEGRLAHGDPARRVSGAGRPPATGATPGHRRPLAVPATGPAPTRASAMTSSLHTDRQVKSKIKDLILAEVAMVRSIESTMSAVQYGTSLHIETVDNAAYRAVEPDVSVVIALYNYGRFIGEAITSVVASEGIAAELVVVDDHSSDDSVEVVLRSMDEFDWFPIRLVMQSSNQGLSPSRNLGFEQARADYVFVLDADNSVYPKALAGLASVLDRTDAAFAYGIIEKFGDSPEIISCLPWNQRRLTEGNYIDAMSLVRKAAWRHVGGFSAEADRMGGWEDYEFWLHLAAEGFRGEMITDFIGRYRAHGSSMLTTLNLETTVLMEHFRSHYPILPWDEQGVRR